MPPVFNPLQTIYILSLSLSALIIPLIHLKKKKTSLLSSKQEFPRWVSPPQSLIYSASTTVPTGNTSSRKRQSHASRSEVRKFNNCMWRWTDEREKSNKVRLNENSTWWISALCVSEVFKCRYLLIKEMSCLQDPPVALSCQQCH